MVISIVIPVGSDETEEMLASLNEYLKEFEGAELFFEYGGTIAEARRRGISKATNEIILCLDVDTRLPKEYLEESLRMIREGIWVTAIDYAEPHFQSHPGFGTSLWRADKLKAMYDWQTRPDRLIVKIGKGEYTNIPTGLCECNYMWLRLKEEGGTAYFSKEHKATHLKDDLNVDS